MLASLNGFSIFSFGHLVPFEDMACSRLINTVIGLFTTTIKAVFSQSFESYMALKVSFALT